MATLRERYSQWHRTFSASDGLPDPRDLRFFSWILDLMQVEEAENKSLLDAACGKGLFLQSAQERGLKTFGVDIADAAIAEAKTTTAPALIVGDGQSLPFAEETFDYVTCLGSLEHFPDPEAGAREIRRVLKQGGTACIYVPNLYFIGHIYLGWRYGTQPSEGHQDFSELFFTREGWQTLIQRCGLEVQSCHKYNEVYASQKVGRVGKFVYNWFIKPWLPLNLSYSFAFICKRDINF
jgi:ubiquinone/menaquinone biosynthesis C-methylase UbiE